MLLCRFWPVSAVPYGLRQFRHEFWSYIKEFWCPQYPFTKPKFQWFQNLRRNNFRCFAPVTALSVHRESVFSASFIRKLRASTSSPLQQTGPIRRALSFNWFLLFATLSDLALVVPKWKIMYREQTQVHWESSDFNYTPTGTISLADSPAQEQDVDE